MTALYLIFFLFSIFNNVFGYYMNNKALVVYFFGASFAHQSCVELFETFCVLASSVAKVVSAVTTTCNLNFTICAKINVANIFPILHKCECALETPIVVSICQVLRVSRSLSFNNEQVLITFVSIKKLLNFSSCLMQACGICLQVCQLILSCIEEASNIENILLIFSFICKVFRAF